MHQSNNGQTLAIDYPSTYESQTILVLCPDNGSSCVVLRASPVSTPRPHHATGGGGLLLRLRPSSVSLDSLAPAPPHIFSPESTARGAAAPLRPRTGGLPATLRISLMCPRASPRHHSTNRSADLVPARGSPPRPQTGRAATSSLHRVGPACSLRPTTARHRPLARPLRRLQFRASGLLPVRTGRSGRLLLRPPTVLRRADRPCRLPGAPCVGRPVPGRTPAPGAGAPPASGCSVSPAPSGCPRCDGS